MRAEGSMEGGSLGMDDVSEGEGDKGCGGGVIKERWRVSGKKMPTIRRFL